MLHPRSAFRRIALTALLATALLACGRPTPSTTPDIVVICLDTLRADRVGVYGRTPTLTPHLDSFAASATVHERAWATSPWTLPSHASMFTGQYAFEHGAHSVSLEEIGEEGVDATNNVVPLTGAAFTIAERLQAAGYRTGAVVANAGYVTSRYGLHQGFEHFDVAMRDVPEIVDAVDAWLADGDGRPTFLFVNTMDTHRPFNLTPRPGFVQPRSPNEGVRLLNELMEPTLRGKNPTEGLERLAALYDLSVANLDDGLGDLFDVLREHGHFDDAVVVVLSDHGEALGEHDLLEHSKGLYDPELRIPFLFKEPGQTTGRRETRETSLVHLPHMLARHTEALPAEVFPYAWPGDVVLAENHYTRMISMRRPWSDLFQRSQRAAIDWPLKVIDSSDGAHEAYDLARDPAETTNVFVPGDVPAEVDSLRSVLLERLENPRATFEKMGVDAIPELTPEEKERLRSLGYF